MNNPPLLKFAAIFFVVGAFCSLNGCKTFAPYISPSDTPQTLKPSDSSFADSLAHFSTATLLDLNYQSEAANSNLIEAIKSDPENEGLYLIVAERLSRDKRTEEAEKVIRLLSERHPESVIPYHWRSLQHQRANEWEKALEQYRLAISANPRDSHAYLRSAYIYHYQNKDDLAAAQVLRKAIKKAEHSLQVYELLGKIYEKNPDKWNRTQTLRMYNSAIKKFPEYAPFYFYIASLNAQNHKLSKAIIAFTRFDQFDPENMEHKKQMANSLVKAYGDAEKATEALTQYMDEKDENNFLSHYCLGVLQEHLHCTNDAIACFNQAITNAPEITATYRKLAQLHMANNDFERAIECLQEGLNNIPQNVHLLEMLALINLQQTNYEESVYYFGQVEKLMDNLRFTATGMLFYYQYALAAQQAGDLELATKKLLAASEIRPEILIDFMYELLNQKNDKSLDQGIEIYKRLDNYSWLSFFVPYNLAHINNVKEDYQSSIKYFEIAEVEGEKNSYIKKKYLNPVFYYLFAMSTERSGAFYRAEQLFSKCLQKNPKFANAYNYLAYMWAEKGIHLDRAMEYIDEGLALQAENGAFIDTKGWIYYQQGAYQKALDWLLMALTKIPDDPTITEHVGDALYKLNRPKEALECWEHALTLEPEDQFTILEKIEQCNSKDDNR